MIVWVLGFGLLFIVLTVPARIFGWACGRIVRRWMRKLKPPTRPPI